MGIDESFKARVEEFLAATGMADTRLGILTLKDPNLVDDLRKGRSPRAETIDIVDAFMQGYGTAGEGTLGSHGTGKPQTDQTRKLLVEAARLILRAEMELGRSDGPVPLGSRIELSRDQGLATVFLWARLPLPAEPVPAPAVPGDTLPPPALQRIEALLPEVLSELRFGRTPRPE